MKHGTALGETIRDAIHKIAQTKIDALPPRDETDTQRMEELKSIHTMVLLMFQETRNGLEEIRQLKSDLLAALAAVSVPSPSSSPMLHNTKMVDEMDRTRNELLERIRTREERWKHDEEASNKGKQEYEADILAEEN